MKRTISAIAAASLTLGTLVPAVFAATGTKGVTYNKRSVVIGSYSANVSGVVAKDGASNTEFIPVFYVIQGLKSLGFTVTWNGSTKDLEIMTPSGVTPDLTNVKPGHGEIGIHINGQLVQNAPRVVAIDPSSGVATTFVPIYYLDNTLKRVGFTPKYNGVSWSVSAQTINDLAINGQSSVPVGTKDSFTLTSKSTTVDPTKVIWSVSGTGGVVMDANGNFIGSTPGTYTVTATYQGTTAKMNVVVYGQAAGLKLTSASGSLVANGASTTTVTATVVDDNGNPVQNFDGTVDFTDTGTQLVNAQNVLVKSLSAVRVTNGLATVTIQATKTAGLTDTITATNLIATGAASAVVNKSGEVTASTTLTQTAQVATSIAVTPTLTSVENNVATADPFTVQVVDQAGQPMLSGTFPISLSVNGPGQLSPSTPTSTVYVGSGAGAPGVQGSVMSLQGQSGPIVVTAASTGLVSGTATIRAVTVGAPVALALNLEKNSTSYFPAGSTTGSVLDLTPVDTSGNPVQDGATYSATVWNGSTQVTSGVTAVVGTNALGNKTVTVTGTVAGTYTIKVTSSDNLSPATTNVTIVPGSATTVAFTTSASNLNLPLANNTTTLSAQLTDQYGNPVNTAGIPVEFTVATTSGTNTATLNGTAGKYVASTDANGLASVLFVGSHTPGDVFTVGIDKVNNATAVSSPVSIKMVAALPSTLAVSLKDTATGTGNNPNYLNSTTYAQAGDQVTVTLTETDVYGNVSPNGDTVQVTLPLGLTNPTALNGSLAPTSTAGVYNVTLPSSGTSTGVATIRATAATSGSASVAARDLSVGSTNLIGNGAIQVVSGNAVGAGLFYQGREITSSNELNVPANTPMQLMLEPVDSQGNPVVEGATPAYVTLSDGGYGGIFKAGVSSVPETAVTIPAGSQGVAVWYQNTIAGTYNLAVSGGSQLSLVTRVVATVASPTVNSGSADAVTITLYDANGNVVPYTGSQTVLVNSTNAGAVSGMGAVNFSNGVGTLQVTAVSAGSQTFTTSVNGVVSNPLSITVGVGALNSVTVGAFSQGGTAGAYTYTTTVQLRDINNNPISDATTSNFSAVDAGGANLVVSSVTPQANVPGTYTVVLTSNSGTALTDSATVTVIMNSVAKSGSSTL